MLNNLREIANHYHFTDADYNLACGIVGSGYREADLVIAPDGNPYLFRWHIVPFNKTHGNVYFHVQVADDPERPLHDHPWDNCSVILAGGYIELLDDLDRLDVEPAEADAEWLADDEQITRHRREIGDVIARNARWGHRLLLPPGVQYTMTLFTTGPKIRRWGFWYPGGWRDADDVCRMDGNVSTHIHEEK